MILFQGLNDAGSKALRNGPIVSGWYDRMK
jgi:hypothetical protein